METCIKIRNRNYICMSYYATLNQSKTIYVYDIMLRWTGVELYMYTLLCYAGQE